MFQKLPYLDTFAAIIGHLHLHVDIFEISIIVSVPRYMWTIFVLFAYNMFVCMLFQALGNAFIWRVHYAQKQQNENTGESFWT